MTDRGTLDQAISRHKRKQSPTEPRPEPVVEPFPEIPPDNLSPAESPDEATHPDESTGVVSYQPDEWTEPVPDPTPGPEPGPERDPGSIQPPQSFSMYALSIDAILPGLHGGIQVVYTALDHTRMSFLCHSIQSIVPVPEIKNPQLRRVSLSDKAWELIGVDEGHRPVSMSEQEWELRLLHYVLPEVERMRKEWLGIGERVRESIPNPVEKFFFDILLQGRTDRLSVIERMRQITDEKSLTRDTDHVLLVSHETASAVVVTYVA